MVSAGASLEAKQFGVRLRGLYAMKISKEDAALLAASRATLQKALHDLDDIKKMLSDKYGLELGSYVVDTETGSVTPLSKQDRTAWQSRKD